MGCPIFYHFKKRNTYNKIYFSNNVTSENIPIITDEPPLKPINNFKELSQTLANVIKSSEPYFTIGIYGEWGTGKTTLMKMVAKILDEQETDNKATLPIMFNAWRCEREEQFATIALMNTIANEMSKHKEFKKMSKTIMSVVEGAFKVIGNKITLSFMTQSLEDIKNEISPAAKFRNEIKDDTFYYDGLSRISEEMEKVKKDNKEQPRIVVFVDDLDRCSPKKTLEVLESIKVFLNMHGFIYVLGINHKTISALIDHSHKVLGVGGAEYIRKIIQVPITLPSWEDKELKRPLLDSMIEKLDEKYKKLLRKNDKELFENARNNPRQLKRLINSFIIACEAFSSKTIKPDFNILLNAFLLKQEKPKFFSLYTEDDSNDPIHFREIIYNFVKALDEVRDTVSKSRDTSGKIELHYYELVMYQLVDYIIRRRLYDDKKVDESAIADERDIEYKLRNTFRLFLWSFDKDAKSLEQSPYRQYQPSEQYKNVNEKLRNLDYDEFIKMSPGDWERLRWKLEKMKGVSRWDQYKEALNMMKEDLEYKT